MKSINIFLVRIFVVAVCLMTINSMFAQSDGGYNPSNIVVPPSPTASAVAKFGDIPVGLYTGVPDISVPLYTFSSRVLSVPINLSYHASGIKVDEVAGWTGLGWALSANYVVTRSVRGGHADEGTLGYKNNPIMDEFDGGILDINQYANEVAAMARGELDGEPDLYHFSFPGGSGSFTFGPDGVTTHIQPFQNIIIEKNGEDSFVITAEDGNIYTYSAVEESGMNSECEGPMGGVVPARSGWYLTKMEDVNGMDEINFNYTSSDISYPSSVSETEYFNNKFDFNCTSPPDSENCLNMMNNTIQRLTSISSPYTGIVEFEATGDRDDLTGGFKLDAINVKNNGNLLRKFLLQYEYYTSQGASAAGDYPSVNKRLKLKSVTEIAADGDSKPPFTFSYLDETDPSLKLPPRLSYAQDHWGFYNGKTSNTGFLPNHIFSEFTYNGNDRNADPEFVSAGMLYRVDYPTGGYNVFNYECNSWGKFTAGNLLNYSSANVDKSVQASATNSTNQPQQDIVTFSIPYGLFVNYSVFADNVNAPGDWGGSISLTNDQGQDFCTSQGLHCGYANPASQGEMLLPAGSYELRVSAFVPGDVTTVNLNWIEHEIYTDTLNIDDVDELFVGGVRVKSVITGDGVNASIDQEKHYEYKEWDHPVNSNKSSGVLLGDPVYSFVTRFANFQDGLDCGTEPCTYRGLNSTSKVPLGSSRGSHIVYSHVRSYEGPEMELGRTDSRYTIAYDKGGVGMPFGPQTSYDWRRGLLKSQIDYKKENGSFAEVRRVENTYNFRKDNSVNNSSVVGLVLANRIVGMNNCVPPSSFTCSAEDVVQVYYGNCNASFVVRGGTNYHIENCDTVAFHPCYGLPIGTELENTVFADQFMYRSYKFLSRWWYLESSLEVQDGVEKITNYEFDEEFGNHTNPILTSVRNSDNDEFISETKYPHDFVNSDPVAQEMLNRNMISIPLETKQLIEGVITSGQRTKMGLFNNRILPQNIYQILPGGSELLRTTIAYQNDGYPSSQTPLSGQNETYTWINGKMESKTLLGTWTSSYEYDLDTWQVLKTTNFDGLFTDYEYDGFQRVKKIKVEGGAKSETIYNYQIGNGNNVVSEFTSFPDGTDAQAKVSFYDGLGRMKRTNINGVDKQETLYDQYGRVESQTYLPGIFKNIQYEPSPLKRPIGESFPDGTNTSLSYGSQGNYYKTISIDENGNATTSISDVIGRGVRTIDALGGITENIYDERGNIKEIIPPNFSTSQEKFQYTYDDRNRQQSKYIPGGGWQRFLYNNKDLPVATLDANNENLNRWLVTEYDVYNRPIKTGFYNGDARIANLDNIVPHQILTETFYDDYGNLPSGMNVDGCLTGAILNGKPVGSRVNILNGNQPGSDWQTSISCYDPFGRVIKTKNSNHLGGLDRESMELDLADNVRASSLKHSTTNGGVDIEKNYDYDDFLRPTKIYHAVNGGSENLICWNNYNDLDQVTHKYLGFNESGSGPDYLQRIDYQYNSRGWLTKINDVESLPIEELPECEGEIEPPGCPPTCDYYLELPCGEDVILMGIFYNGGQLMPLSYPYYCYNPAGLEQDIENWFNANNLMYTEINVTVGNSLIIEVIGSEVMIEYLVAYSQFYRNGRQIFKGQSFNCSDDKPIPTDICDICRSFGYSCARCPFGNFQTACETCEQLENGECANCIESDDPCQSCSNLGYENCETCPLTMEALQPLQLNLRYNLADVADPQNAYIIQMSEISRHWLHDGNTEMTYLDHTFPAGEITNINQFDPVHSMEINITDQWVLENNMPAVQTAIAALITNELTLAGINNVDAVNAFIDAVELELENMWGGSATGNNPPIDTDPGGLKNPDLFAMDLMYGEGNAIIGSPGELNGNISGITWGVHSKQRQTYGFEYDAINRLKSATHASLKSEGDWDDNDKYGMAATYDPAGNIMSLSRNGVIENCPYPEGIQYGFEEIDNLAYTYGSGNKLTAIADASKPDRGFKGGGGSIGYDANGNMTNIGYKSANMSYNHLNLPYQFQREGNNIAWKYDAVGTKLQKKVLAANPDATYTKDYVAGIEYKDDVLEAIYHEEGRVVKSEDGDFVYEYYLKDHLGNTRVVFSDKNKSGYLEPFVMSPYPYAEDYTEMQQENHYYPFGMAMEGPWEETVFDPENGYQYNGKELNEDLGLDWNDYGARWYDASIGRWNAVDPLAEEMNSWSPYNYTFSNPINFIDPDGRSPLTGQAAQDAFRDLQSGQSFDKVETDYVDEKGNTLLKTNDGSDEVFVIEDGNEDQFVEDISQLLQNGEEANVNKNHAIGEKNGFNIKDSNKRSPYSSFNNLGQENEAAYQLGYDAGYDPSDLNKRGAALAYQLTGEEASTSHLGSAKGRKDHESGKMHGFRPEVKNNKPRYNLSALREGNPFNIIVNRKNK